MIYRLFRAIARPGWSGQDCRRCAEPIASRDAFGQSEGVCRPCRG